jgi:hypothetical protein
MTGTCSAKWSVYMGSNSFISTLDAGLLARSQYPEGPATGILDTGFFFGFPGSKSKC